MPNTRTRLLTGGLAAAVTLALTSVAASPATAASTDFSIDLPSVSDSSGSSSTYAFITDLISPATASFSVTMPPEFFSFTPTDAQYWLNNDNGFFFYEATVSGNVIAGTFDPGALSPGSFTEFGIEIFTANFESASNAVFTFETSDTDTSTDPLVLDHASLDRVFFNTQDAWFFDNAEPLVVRPGDTVTFTASPGTFTNGPLGTWDPATLEQYATANDFFTSVPTVLDISLDGSMLTVTVPRPRWNYGADNRVFIDANLIQVDDITPEQREVSSIYLSYPIEYAAAPPPAVERVAGPDRFTVSQNIARESYPSGAQTVYITNGLNYPDALSAAPAAAFEGGPLLLTLPTAMPAGLEQTIRDLDPDTIVVVGGPNSVNADVYNQLSTLVGPSNITRLGGADRFDASRTIARTAFGGTGSSTAFIATGLNFPDALSASAAAGSIGAPVILVNGTQPTLDPATLQVLNDLGVDLVYIAGGPNSVPSTVETQLSTIGFGVERLSGADRFEASSNIARVGFPTAERVFLATGFNFPDALAGAAWAASTRSPLIVVPGTCVPTRVLADLSTYQVSDVTILGGPNSVSAAVENLTPCAGFAWDTATPVSAIEDGELVRAGFNRTRDVLDLNQ